MKPTRRDRHHEAQRALWERYTGQDERPVVVKLLELAAVVAGLILVCLLIKACLP